MKRANSLKQPTENGASFNIEMVTLENGGIVKSIHGSIYKDSYRYCLFGSKGRIETARWDPTPARFQQVYVNLNDFDGQYK